MTVFAGSAGPPARRVLMVSTPTRIHPWLEGIAAGAPVGEFDVHQLSKPAQLAVWKSHMRWLRANPRSAAYMLQAAALVLADLAPGATIDLVADAPMTAAAATSPLAWGDVHAAGDRDIADVLRSTLTDGGRYEFVLLLYRDAIGLRWSRLDRLVLRALPGRVRVLNGRRRLFALDRSTWTALRRRRALDVSWAPELLLAPVTVIAAALLAVWDGVTRADRRQSAAQGESE